LSLWRTPVAARHGAGHAAFIDKHQAGRIERVYLGAPSSPLVLIGWGIALAGVQ
jgi:hypothetical protein